MYKICINKVKNVQSSLPWIICAMGVMHSLIKIFILSQNSSTCILIIFGKFRYDFRKPMRHAMHFRKVYDVPNGHKTSFTIGVRGWITCGKGVPTFIVVS